MFDRIFTAYFVLFHCTVSVIIHLAEYFQLLVVKLRNLISPLVISFFFLIFFFFFVWYLTITWHVIMGHV